MMRTLGPSTAWPAPYSPDAPANYVATCPLCITTDGGHATREAAQRVADAHNTTVHGVPVEDDTDLAPSLVDTSGSLDEVLARDLLRLTGAMLADQWTLDNWPAARAFIARTLPATTKETAQ